MKKSTEELLDLMKNSRNYEEYLAVARNEIGSSHMKLDRALNACLAEKGKSKASVIAASGIETHYAYQIFSGAKAPTRDKVLMLCFGLGLNGEETQRFLKITGYAQLYGKEERDNAILFGLTKKYSIIAMNILLDEMHLPLLQ